MNVLWVSPYPVFGGPHNAALQIAEPLKTRGWESVVLLPEEPGNAAERLRAAGVETILLPLHRIQVSPDPRVQLRTAFGLRQDAARIGELIAERDFGLVVLTGIEPHAAIAARRKGAAIVWQVLASRPPPAVRTAWMAMIRHWADTVMFNGELIERMYIGRRGLDLPKFQVKWAVDTRRLRPDRRRGAATRAGLGVPEDALLVGSLGNLVPMKGVEYFIRAAAPIHRRRPDSWFLIAGSTYAEHESYRSRLEQEIRASEVPAARFKWSEGPLDELYPALDLMAISSVPRSEGTTTTALEAMACEIPVVATNAGSVPEIVIDGVTGTVVPPCDSDALAAAIVALAGDPARARELGTEGRRRVIDQHSIEQLTQTHARAFESAMAHNRSR